MKTIYDNWDMLQQMMDLLENQFGAKCEVILHDLTKDYEHTIVDIRNGYITGRKIGDCGTNLGLEVLRGTVRKGDRYNYVVHTQDGKILRSSTMFFTNDDGEVIGSLCVNLDITQTVAFEGYLHQFNGTLPGIAKQPQKETFDGNISGVLDFMIEQAFAIAQKDVDAMTREDKIKFIGFLDKKGAFLVTKAGDRICDYLKISRFTLYNYLETARSEAAVSAVKGDQNEYL